MQVSELEARLGGEVVGGRLIAQVDGKRQYLTDVNGNLNELGLLVSNSLEQADAAKPAEAAEPARRRRRAEAPADPEIEV